jgi:hypothetical protein
MADDDYAIVVGINAYPGLKDASDAVGAESDACAFQEWLLDPAGGALPLNKPEQCKLIVTSQFGPPPEDPMYALPTVMHIWQAAQDLLNRGPGHVGRRLYLYFAGHGIAPQESETALLTANAQKGALGSLSHWLGEYTAEHFRQSGYFDEVLLFMDCCREVFPIDAPCMPWGPLRAAAFPEVKRFYAYATRWSELTYARPTAAGGVGGEFTAALLEGLKRAGYEPHSGGQITTGSLKKYLLNKLRIDKLPRLKDSDFRADDFVVTQVQPVEYPVVIQLPGLTAGMQAQIRVARDGRFHVLHQTIAAPPTWEQPLYKGSYEVQVLAAGLQKEFDVDGTGGCDVQL